MHDLAENPNVLRKRLDRLIMREFLLPAKAKGQPAASRSFKNGLFRYAKPDVSRTLGELEQIGQLALIGGAVRDVARAGVERFQSDLDFVFHNGDLSAYVSLMEKLDAVRNRFGGYRLKVGRSHVDVWALEHTWAHVAGHRHVGRIEDLVLCTFFDWDAILYDLRTGRIIASNGYFDRVRSGVLEINLVENPNPRGSLVRALRRGALWQVKFGAVLTKFATKHLAEEDWSELVALDERAFAKPILRHVNPASLRHGLYNMKFVRGAAVSEPFGCTHEQFSLPL